MKQAVDLNVDGLSRFRIDLAYAGTSFQGWAKQPGLRTVQGELLRALETVFGKTNDDFGMRVAGRTDAGVHAEAQVLHIDLNAQQLSRVGRSRDYVAKLNSLLPREIRVSSMKLAPKGFDARFSASFRRYRYTIADSISGHNPLQSGNQLWLTFPLDVYQMQLAGNELLGLHDFAAFSKARENATAIRELKVLRVKRNKAKGSVVEIELMADAFAHNMVRSIVGALVKVGVGKASPRDVAKALKSKQRSHGFKVVGPEGLSLIQVGYPANKDLAKQAEKARNFRTLED